MKFSIGENTEGITILQSKPNFYHDRTGRKSRDVPLTSRRIIAWDGEGMKLSGDNKPQHYVILGCSAETSTPLIGRDLHTGEILEYICKIGENYPSAVHIGYGFRYDSNMIVRHLPLHNLRDLKDKNETYYKYNGCRYRIAWLPGKRFQVTRQASEKHRKVTVTIDDILSFFASSFIKAIESVLGDELTDEDRQVIAHGKGERGNTTWDDLDEVLHYWRAEIRLMERLGDKFRDVMYAGGFMLRDWYGPGALSSYLIRTRGLRNHTASGPPVLPQPVHRASKIAYAGGRFELFRMGRIEGPVYSLDINSAYPYAMSKAPSLGEDHGFWQHVETPSEVAYFGVYRIRFKVPGAKAFEDRPMPLFHRDSRGNISFPNVCEGWYWSPEAASVIGRNGVEVIEGWEWINDGNRPFIFLQEMFNRRLEIGKKNVMSMPFKLGPNSMYGKFAQRVGWNEKTNSPPKSHCLPLAGWVTSYCRAMLYNIIRQIPLDQIIAVETDGIFTTHDPSRLRGVTLGSGIGEWDADVSDEMLYLQNGIYHRRKGKDWLAPKARGLDQQAVSLQVIADYLRVCKPGDFPPLSVSMRERFIGLTAASAGKAPLKVRHCRWEGGIRELEPGGKGKRVHIPAACPACAERKTAWEMPHTLCIRSQSFGQMSAPHFIPWDRDEPYPDQENAELLDAISEDTL
jgi:hypothetical protein